MTPNWTQRLTLHLNGGSKFSELHFEILRDGRPTGITRHTRTDGSPRYRKTSDTLICGDDQFNILRDGPAAMLAWCEEQAAKATQAAGRHD